jgi:signal transduction histidine kinase
MDHPGTENKPTAHAARFRLSTSMTLVALFVLLAVASNWASFYSFRNALNSVIHDGERSKVKSIGMVIDNIVKLHVERLAQTTQLLARNAQLPHQLQHPGEETWQALDAFFGQFGSPVRADLLEVVDASETVVSSSSGPERRGKKATLWGVSEALAGRSMLASFTQDKDIYICAIEPVRFGDKIVGALVAAVRLGGEFIGKLGKEAGAELVLLSRGGAHSGSEHGLIEQVDAKAVDEAFYQKMPIFRHDPAERSTMVYLPLLIIDEGYVLLVRIDSSEALRTLDKSQRESAVNTFSILAAAIVLGLLCLHYVLRPLRRLRARAEQAAIELTGEDIRIRSRDEVLGVVAVMETLTGRLVRQNAELSAANDKLRELDQMKSELVSSVSHELRTPLTSILGFSKLILRDFKRILDRDGTRQEDSEKLARRARENLEIIVAEGERLTCMINDLLDLAKIESGTVQWRDQPVNAAELVRKVGDAVAGLFERNPSVQFIKRVSPRLPPVAADPDRLHQVLLNLISNAAKFTARGIVELAVECDGNSVRFCVKDTGKGISSQEIELIFKPFYQAVSGSSLENKPQGTGLGLSICRGILDHYGSSLKVCSQEGSGSEFCFDLPVAQALGESESPAGQ